MRLSVKFLLWCETTIHRNGQIPAKSVQSFLQTQKYARTAEKIRNIFVSFESKKQHKNKDTKQLQVEIQAPAGNKGVNLRLNNYFKTEGQNNYEETSSGK